ncbi:MAG TPA: hypothetical protein VFB72_06395 [Verrucomicrobiae bacterium]|nr:hypothetical protein [Verrucomicrobiae bacterium]
MEIKQRQKLLLIIAGIGILLLAGDSLLFEPMLAGWKARSKQIDDMRKEVNDDKYLVQREVELRSRWDNMRTNALASNRSQAEAQLFRAFDRWEHASGISRVGIKPQWKQGDDDSYATLECRVDYNGDIDKIKRFLYELEKDPTGIKVDYLEITAHDEAGQQLALGLQVSGLQLNPAPESQQQQ